MIATEVLGDFHHSAGYTMTASFEVEGKIFELRHSAFWERQELVHEGVSVFRSTLHLFRAPHWTHQIDNSIIEYRVVGPPFYPRGRLTLNGIPIEIPDPYRFHRVIAFGLSWIAAVAPLPLLLYVPYRLSGSPALRLLNAVCESLASPSIALGCVAAEPAAWVLSAAAYSLTQALLALRVRIEWGIPLRFASAFAAIGLISLASRLMFGVVRMR